MLVDPKFIQTPFLITEVERGHYSQTMEGIKLRFQYVQPQRSPQATALFKQYGMEPCAETIKIGGNVFDLHIPEATIPHLQAIITDALQITQVETSTSISPLYIHLYPENIDFGDFHGRSLADPAVLDAHPQLRDLKYEWGEQYLRLKLTRVQVTEVTMELRLVIIGEIRREETLIEEFREILEQSLGRDGLNLKDAKKILNAKDLGGGWVGLEKDEEFFGAAPLILILFKVELPRILQLIQ